MQSSTILSWGAYDFQTECLETDRIVLYPSIMPSVMYLGTGSATMSKMEIYNYASLWTTEITQQRTTVLFAYFTSVCSCAVYRNLLMELPPVGW